MFSLPSPKRKNSLPVIAHADHDQIAFLEAKLSVESGLADKSYPQRDPSTALGGNQLA